MADGDPVPRSTTDELLAQVRDELRKSNERAERQDRERGAGELREPAEPKQAAKKPAASTSKKK